MLPEEQLIPWRKVRKLTCVHCGYCCEEYDVPVTFEEEERLKVFGDVFSRGKLGVYLKKVNGKCIFRRRKRCSIYELRPMACVRYPFFVRESGCEEAKLLLDGRELFVYVDGRCKGIGRGSKIEDVLKNVIRRVLLVV